MTTLLRRSRLLALAAVLVGIIPALKAEDSTAANPLEPFRRFVGGAWKTHGDVKVRVVYEWGLNKKLLKIKSYLGGESGEKLVYESVVYWHPQKKHVAFQSVSAQGGLFDGVMTVQGNTFSSEFTSYNDDKVTPYRQTLEFLDDDHVIWTVLGKKGDEWVTLHKENETRVKEAEAK